MFCPLLNFYINCFIDLVNEIKSIKIRVYRVYKSKNDRIVYLFCVIDENLRRQNKIKCKLEYIMCKSILCSIEKSFLVKVVDFGWKIF